jgi:hypothetical protein
VVYGAGGLMKTILKPGDASDDINIPIGSSRLFDAGFEVTKYVISKTVAGSESETLLFDVKQLRPQPISFATSVGGAVLALSIDFASGLLNPGPNPIPFTNGTAASLPGWTVGTGVDFTTGNITG